MRLLISIIIACMALTTAQAQRLDSLYTQLDEAINNADTYVQEREQRIDRLRLQLQGVRSSEDRYRLAMEIFREYDAYRSDSAFHYINICIKTAEQASWPQLQADAMARKAFLAATVGMYHESMELLDNIKPEMLDSTNRGTYYTAQQHLYGELGYYTTMTERRNYYFKKADSFLPLVYENLPDDDDNKLMRLEMDYFAKNQPQRSLEVNDKRMSLITPESRTFAIVAFYRYLDYVKMGQEEQAREWLIKAAISDIKHGVYDQGALWELAQGLSNDGDVVRSHRYINYAWQCAKEFGTRVRNWQITPVLRTIDQNYHDRVVSVNRKLQALVAAVCTLLVVLLVALYFVRKQTKKVTLMRDQLAETNKKEQELNQQLADMVRKLGEANTQLGQVNRSKEEYIGRLLTLCSAYVDRIDKFRSQVNRRVKNHEYELLYKETRSHDAKEQDINDLYQHFDSAFLHLFPNFVADFNALLKPEEQVQVTEDGRLSTSLRIFALIRLGVEDSSKIAEFLHYSVNTIYNYRARIKNGALTDRETFEQRVKEIGMPKTS